VIEDDEDELPEPAWPFPGDGRPMQYGVEGTIERIGAFASGAGRARGARGVLARVGVVLVLAGLAAGILLSLEQALTLLH